MRRGSDALVSVGALALLMVVLAAMDVRVRERFGDFLRGASGSDAGTFADRLSEIGGTVLVALWDQSVANAPLTIFCVAAVVLVAFMLRT
jgi:hypothetical protein